MSTAIRNFSVMKGLVSVVFLSLSASLVVAQTGATGGTTGQSAGVIEGVVIDANGRPVSQATVEIVVDPHPPKEPSKRFTADADGHFSIRPVAWGTYHIYAIEPRSGRTPLTWSIARDEPGPAVTVSPETSDAHITVRTGVEPARLAPIAVVDSVTGKPITVTDPGSADHLSPVNVTIMRLDSNGVAERGVQTNAPVVHTNTAGLEVLIPALVPVTIKVHAAGYADWYYPGTPDRLSASPIVLKQGETLNLGNILLSPVSN